MRPLGIDNGQSIPLQSRSVGHSGDEALVTPDQQRQRPSRRCFNSSCCFSPEVLRWGFPVIRIRVLAPSKRTKSVSPNSSSPQKVVFKGVAPNPKKSMYQAVNDALGFMEANATRDSGMSAVTSSGPPVAPNGNRRLMGASRLMLTVYGWLLGRMVEISAGIVIAIKVLTAIL